MYYLNNAEDSLLNIYSPEKRQVPSKWIRRQVEAAYGWLGLDCCEEARRELEKIPPMFRVQEDVTACKVQILMKEEKWQAAYSLCVYLMRHFPEHLDAYLNGACCLHRQSQSEEAKFLLLSAPVELREDPVFFYNLACYECNVGNFRLSRLLLDRSVDMDPEFYDFALIDTDLEALWEDLVSKPPSVLPDPSPQAQRR